MPDVVIRKPAAARPPSTVGPVQPTEAWAATPAGLSTATMSSSEYSTVMPTTSSTRFSGGEGCSGSRTSSHAPEVRRSDFDARAPSMSTAPSSASAAAAVRDSPSRRAMPASTRIPASPSGTGMDLSAIGAFARLAPADDIEVVAEQGQAHERHGAADHRCVGDVEHGPPADRQKVHDMPAQRSGPPEESVDEVAQRPAQDHAQAKSPPRRHQSAAHPDDP